MNTVASKWMAFALVLVLAFTCAVSMAASPAEGAAVRPVVVVTRDMAALRAAPQANAASTSVLWRGELLEVRGERGDYLQVWDHQRERGGFVLREQLHALHTTAADVPGLAALLAFVSDQPGAETLGLALAAAVIQALPPQDLQGPVEAAVLDAVGRQAERLGERATRGAGERGRDQNALTAHLDIAARQGIRFHSVAAGDAVVLCYEGDAHRRLLAHRHATPEQRVRAVLALTRPDCVAEPVRPAEREALDQQRERWLSQVPVEGLAPHWAARLQVRQAEVFSRLAFAAARRGDARASSAAARLAMDALSAAVPDGLSEADQREHLEAVLRTNAVRWAATPFAGTWPVALPLRIEARPDGQTCVRVVDEKLAEKTSEKTPEKTLAERCTWGQVWPESAQRNRERNAIVLAVQPIDGWRELWVFRHTRQGWQVLVQPPAALLPGVGYAEFAGWVPGGQSMLVAREAVAEGRSIRRFEVVGLDNLIPQRTAFHAEALGPFNRWADARWKRLSLAMR
jgi:hypothetical protein